MTARARASVAHVSDRVGTHESNDGAPGVEVAEHDIFEEWNYPKSSAHMENQSDIQWETSDR